MLLEQHNLRLPARAQKMLQDCGARIDLYCGDSKAALHVGGPPRHSTDRPQRVMAPIDKMQEVGFTVIRFKHSDNWQGVIAEFSSVFGKEK